MLSTFGPGQLSPQPTIPASVVILTSTAVTPSRCTRVLVSRCLIGSILVIFNFSWSHISPNLQRGHQKKIGLQNLLLQLMPLLLNFILSHPNGIVALELVLRSKSYSACHWLLKHHQFIIWKKIGCFNPISVLTKNLPQSTAISYPGHTGNLFQFIWYNTELLPLSVQTTLQVSASSACK